MRQAPPTISAQERAVRAQGSLGYCIWDQFPLNYPGMRTQLEYESTDFQVIRFEHRTAAYRALQAVGAGAGQEQWSALAAEHTARTTAWSSVRGQRNESGPIPWYLHPYMRIPMAATVVMVALTVRDIALGEPPLLMLILLLVASASWFVAVAYIRRGRMLQPAGSQPLNIHDASNALALRACPDCGYGLTGVTPAIDPELLNWVDVGPEVCPECVSKWPCVPPPAGLAPKSKKQRDKNG